MDVYLSPSSLNSPLSTIFTSFIALHVVYGSDFIMTEDLLVDVSTVERLLSLSSDRRTTALMHSVTASDVVPKGESNRTVEHKDVIDPSSLVISASINLSKVSFCFFVFLLSTQLDLDNIACSRRTDYYSSTINHSDYTCWRKQTYHNPFSFSIALEISFALKTKATTSNAWNRNPDGSYNALTQSSHRWDSIRCSN